MFSLQITEYSFLFETEYNFFGSVIFLITLRYYFNYLNICGKPFHLKVLKNCKFYYEEFIENDI